MSTLHRYEYIATFKNEVEKTMLKIEFDKSLHEANSYYESGKNSIYSNMVLPSKTFENTAGNTNNTPVNATQLELNLYPIINLDNEDDIQVIT